MPRIEMGVTVMKALLGVSSAIGLLVATATIASAASPNGTWLRPNGGAHIQVFNCSGGLGMKIVKPAAKRPGTRGKTIMCGAKKSGANKWRGSILSTEDGQTYTGIVTLTGGSSLKLEGCVLGGIICKAENWRRLK